MIFLFDGLDQIQTHCYKKLTNDIFKVVSKYPVYISSRPSSVLEFESDRNKLFLSLKPFSMAEQKQYFGDHYKKSRRLSKFAPDLTRIPMLAAMVKTLLSKGLDKGICNRTDLYSHFLKYIIYDYSSHSTSISKKIDVEDVLKRVSYEALALKEPHIQLIPARFYHKLNLNIAVDDLPKFGLTNLILGKTDSPYYLFFTHQSFQEFLAAQYINDHEEIIDKVCDEVWAAKWKEVIKFLAGMRGQEFIEKILGKKDNVIHSLLLLTGECIPEVKVTEEKSAEEIKGKLRELANIEPFNFDATIALVLNGDINPLKALISYHDESIQRLDIAALYSLKDRLNDEIAREIVGWLKDDDEEIRIFILEALYYLKESLADEVVREIVGWLKDRNLYSRRDATTAYCHLADRLDDKAGKEVVREIVGWLKDGDLTGISAICYLADKLDNKAVKEIVRDKEVVREIFVELLYGVPSLTADVDSEAHANLIDRLGEDLVKIIVGWLTAGDYDLRIVAIKFLPNLVDRLDDKAGKEVVREIVGWLKDGDYIWQYWAMEVLAHLKDCLDYEVIKEIVGWLEDGDESMLLFTIMALPLLKDKLNNEAVKEIVALLKDTNFMMSRTYIEPILNFTNELDDVIICKTLGLLSEDNDNFYRDEAIQALPLLKDKLNNEAVKEIVALLKDNDIYVRRYAIETLVEFTDILDIVVIREIFGLITVDSEEMPQLLQEALPNLVDRLDDKAGKEVIREIVGWLKDGNYYMRRAAIRVLPHHIDRIDDNDVREWLKDGNLDKRWVALNVFSKPGDSLDDEVVKDIVVLLKDNDYWVRREAMFALKKLYESGIKLP